MLLAHGIVCSAHVEQDAAILEHSGCGMVGEVFFDALRQPAGGGRRFTGGHAAPYQPCRARRLVMCAVWWRECQS